MLSVEEDEIHINFTEQRTSCFFQDECLIRLANGIHSVCIKVSGNAKHLNKQAFKTADTRVCASRPVGNRVSSSTPLILLYILEYI